jgi:hypothetical protein
VRRKKVKGSAAKKSSYVEEQHLLDEDGNLMEDQDKEEQ